MPIYEYECGACGAHVERLVRRKDDIPGACPKCGAKKMKKIFSAFAVTKSSPSGDMGPACASCDGGSCPYGAGGDCSDLG